MPWSKSVIDDSINALKDGIFTSLDIEFGGSCSFSCIYCETPYRDKESSINLNKIIEFISTKQFKWIYVCGIGEPTHKKNEYFLRVILEACRLYGTKCSIFTNLAEFPKWLIEFIKDDILYLVIKFDSLNPENLKKIYQTKDIGTYFKNLENIFNLVQSKDGITNIAASIVPTSKNINEIESLVNTCLENDIFPFIGQLEYSGSAKKTFKKLYINNECLQSQKKIIETIIGEKYFIPICPALLSSFHISNENKVTVDQRTGLSCHWFWLDEPRIENLCELTDEISIQEITKKLFEIRISKFKYFVSSEMKLKYEVFGGCGGNKRDIFNIYFDLVERSSENGK